MTAQEIIEQFSKLPEDEQEKIIAHFFGAQTMLGVSPAAPKVTAEFRAIASGIFGRNNELFKKLAD